MSLSNFFHTLIGTKNAILEKFEDSEESVILHARLLQKDRKCSCCGSLRVRIKDSMKRSFRTPNLGEKRSYLKITTHKFLCHNCGKTAWMNLPFTMGKFPLTKSFINHILSLVKISTIQHVAELLGLDWKTVKKIDKENLKKRPKQFSYKKLRYLSIDEIAIKKGHSYMTIISDIHTGMIIYAVEGRKDECISGFLKQLAKRAKRLKGIAMDMSAGYAAAVKKYLPKVAIIFDHFHVTKVINSALDEVRKVEWRKCQADGIDAIKGERFLLLRNFDSLGSTQKAGVEKLLKINRNLSIVYMMKEQFRFFWMCKTREEGWRFLLRWIMGGLMSDIEILQKAARTILNHAGGLLTYFTHKISNAKAEGINNKIKVMKRQSYGCRDIEYFKLKLYNLHKKSQQLVG
jgi:transposase